MQSTLPQVLCVGCATIAGISGTLWAAFGMVLIMFAVTMLDLYFMWRRCKNRRTLIAKRLHRRRATDGDGTFK